MTAIVDDFVAIRAAKAGAPSSETEIQALWREASRLTAEALSKEDPAADGAREICRAEELYDKIIDLPAVTIDDALVQARMLAWQLPIGGNDETLTTWKIYDSLLAFLCRQAGREPPTAMAEKLAELHRGARRET